MLQDYSNGDTEMTWYNAVDISFVRMQHRYIMEGVSPADVFHEEDFDPSIETASVDDKKSRLVMYQ